MTAVPQSLREASYALGANRMRTTLRVVFPAAISGIAASIVLGLSPRRRRDDDRRAWPPARQAKMVSNPLEAARR